MKLASTRLACCALILVACGESHDNEMDAGATIFFDATFPDAGTDAGPPPANVGALCESDDECTGPDAYCEPNLGGYCTSYCDETIPCPEGSSCIGLGGGQNVCLADCDPSAEDQCLPGNGCTMSTQIPPVCLPGCEDDSDCSAGEMCEVGGGFIGSGTCFDPSVAAGAECWEREDCGTDAACLNEASSGWPGGYCAGLECEVGSNAGCADGATCVVDRAGSTFCLAQCASATDCRPGYTCTPFDPETPEATVCLPGCTEDSQCTVAFRDGTRYVCNPGTGYCDAPFDPADLGQPCDGSWRSCSGGLCLEEDETGWPAGTCAYPGCRLSGEGPAAVCPEGSTCIDAGGDPELGVCVSACTVGTTSCREGYVCVPSSDGATDGACQPPCTTDSCSEGQTCDDATGLCQ